MRTKTTIVLVLAAATVLAAVLIGAAYAQTETSSPGGAAGGFFNWMGRCLGFRAAVTGTADQPLNVTVTDPNTGATRTFQSYGYGPCMRGYYP